MMQELAEVIRQARAHHAHGTQLLEQDRVEEAAGSFRRAADLCPDDPQNHMSLGSVLLELGHTEEALQSYSRVIALEPSSFEAHCNKGGLLIKLHRFDEAISSLEAALRIRSDIAEIHYNLAGALMGAWRFEDAVKSFDRALALKPTLANAYYNRAYALKELNRLPEALASYRRAVELLPDKDWLYGAYLHTKLLLCDWRGLDAELRELTARIRREERVIWPFALLAMIDSPALHRRAAETFVRNACPPRPPVPVRRRQANGKIRIGYFSTDYHNHAVSFLAAGMYEKHDRSRFHITAFSLGPDAKDEMRARLVSAFDQFIDVRARTNRQIAELSREHGIDIAVDLNGYTRDHRMEIFSYRAAPIQVNYLGYPGTVGAPYVDYIVADETLIPPEHRRYFTERIVYLPYTYQPNDAWRSIGAGRVSREELGLPSHGFVFCCFNNSFKITPAVFDSWMRILRRVEGSVLWLLISNEAIAARLRSEAEARGVSGARLVFAHSMAPAQHLARHAAAELFLDTLPYNAHTTASDALWCGLPVLTRMGESFPARVAASLLNAVELPELITTTEEEYEALAVDLATNPMRLAAVRDKLRARRASAPLFDIEAYTRALETAFTLMHERYMAGSPADHIFVAGRDRGSALIRP